MNEQKICFIICTNKNLLFNECLWYLDQLIIPQGYYAEYIPVRNASNMVQGYAYGQLNSDAKYKIYIHQDTFIVDRHFLIELVDTFTKRKDIGLLGVIGGNVFSPDGVMWNKWNVGRTLGCDGTTTYDIVRTNDNFVRDDVWAIDGMLMATQYDIPWRDDLDIGWDFYDITQSIEFLKHGYKVGIMNSRSSFTLHDCGPSKLANYDNAREKVFKAYPEIFTEEFTKTNYAELAGMTKEISEKILTFAKNRKYCELELALREVFSQRIPCRTYEMCMALYFYNIYIKEKEEDKYTFFSTSLEWNEMVQKYEKVKNAIRRVWYDSCENNKKYAKGVIESEKCSDAAVKGIIASSIPKEFFELITSYVLN